MESKYRDLGITLEEARRFFYVDGKDIRNKVDRYKAKAGEISGSPDTKGHIRVGFKGRHIAAHHISFLVKTGNPPRSDMQIDHKDRNKKNNNPDNLREVTTLQNQLNKSKSKNNKSGVKGVYFCKKSNKWRVSLS